MTPPIQMYVVAITGFVSGAIAPTISAILQKHNQKNVDKIADITIEQKVTEVYGTIIKTITTEMNRLKAQVAELMEFRCDDTTCVKRIPPKTKKK